VISEFPAHHFRGVVDVFDQSRERGVPVQPDVAVPPPELRKVRLAHAGSVAFPFGVDRLDQARIQKLAVRDIQRENERRKVAGHLEGNIGRTGRRAVVRGFAVRRQVLPSAPRTP